MIVDKLENADLYVNVNSRLKKAFEFLKDNDIQKLSDGKYEIDGDNIYASVQSYVTQNEAEKRFESHEKYIDIQYISKGQEFIAWSPIENLTVEEAYSKEKDVAFYKDGTFSSKINLDEDYFCIFFPKDAHKPGCTLDKTSQIKKVVVKIKIA
ncbi:YhcH/YjgK/YiaL family protein [Clostridium felsineum]|uniref:Toxin-antitoxin biofilm protein TabA n=1 Tax=Clostridium felsineum TaxID=36839 RepID=A0A1S8MFN9_9CLOT|nr:YhcH/YjgK/YiaL family protein [Clostridium felsineum]MCR3761285.1 YhcH/YjgK/YiaL family protein [Clostridium felsineum]URZ05629.1 Toxin-antitoxin biofilm protein TabA [Clostridium felsineum]URZ10668.1 Toxin-antitoxin biofilm protein TabA [Clostridium felsineum]URZ17417.1 Toxin-antitoxin biofilm protein TabA [Clostridium felsineum DSM 794]